MQHSELQETSRREDARRLALHVWFLAGGDGLAAHVAAHWAKFLTNGSLEVKAAGPGGADLIAASNCVPADLVVVIHTPVAPEPLVANHCGGRIDWDLGIDVAESPVELAAQVRRHVMWLLGDLGMAQAHSDAPEYSSCPSMVLDPNRFDARACLFAA